MTFSARELSAESGAPIELYEFRYGPVRLYYTSSELDVVYLSRTWTGLPIARTEIEETSEMSRQAVTLTVPALSEIANLFRVAPPSDVVEVLIRGVHITDETDELASIWVGRVLNCKYDGARAELSCESIRSSLRRQGLRRPYQRSCPHVLYGLRCGVNRTAHRLEDQVSFVAGAELVVPDVAIQPSGYYAGGEVEWERGPGRYERRMIRIHVDDTLVLTHPIPGLSGGATLAIFPGCAHEPGDCADKFGNMPNYGGWPIPQRNPFGTSGAF